MHADPLATLRAWVDSFESQTKAAKAIGIPQATLSRILSGARNVGGAVAARIQQAAGIQASDWWTITAEPTSTAVSALPPVGAANTRDHVQRLTPSRARDNAARTHSAARPAATVRKAR